MEVQRELEAILGKLVLANVTPAATLQTLKKVERLGDPLGTVIDDGVAQLKQLGELRVQELRAHQKLHELEGERVDCTCHPCRARASAVRAHARGVRRLAAREFRLGLGLSVAINARHWKATAAWSVLPCQAELGAVCHFLQHQVRLSTQQVGLLRLLASGVAAPTFSQLKARRGSSKQAAWEFSRKSTQPHRT